MSSLKDPKTIIPLFIIIVLIGVAGYFTYLISNGEDPLVLINSRATDSGTDDNLTSDPVEDPASPTPTITFSSTTITPEVSVSPTSTPIATPAVSITVMITQIPTETPTIDSPTPIAQLPVAGINDFMTPVVLGSGVLILLALFL